MSKHMKILLVSALFAAWMMVALLVCITARHRNIRKCLNVSQQEQEDGDNKDIQTREIGLDSPIIERDIPY